MQQPRPGQSWRRPVLRLLGRPLRRGGAMWRSRPWLPRRPAGQLSVRSITEAIWGPFAKDVTSSESLKNYVAAGVSGGIGGANIGVRLAVNSALQTVTNGGKFKDNLSQAAVGLVAWI